MGGPPDPCIVRDAPTTTLSMENIQQVLPSGNFRFLLCGPPGLMESLVPGLLEWGVPDDRIYFEAFGPASAAHAAPERFERSVSPPRTGTLERRVFFQVVDCCRRGRIRDDRGVAKRD